MHLFGYRNMVISSGPLVAPKDDSILDGSLTHGSGPRKPEPTEVGQNPTVRLSQATPGFPGPKVTGHLWKRPSGPIGSTQPTATASVPSVPSIGHRHRKSCLKRKRVQVA